ncbi:MAG: hypothetical protein JXB48_06010 [Candidatus Latescibacteria bacterium]|nr:hypothetical protein [Candidatus Latescibacterota bacterium]
MKRYGKCIVILIIHLIPFYTFPQSTQKDSSYSPLYSTATDVNDSSFYYRVGGGASGGETEGIHLFETYKKGLHYHVFSMSGDEVLSATRMKKESPEGCSSDDERTSWLLQPDTIYEPDQLQVIYDVFSCLVVGTKNAARFNSPKLVDITDDMKIRCKKVLGITDSVEIEPIEYYSAGRNEKLSRILLKIPTGYGATLAIVDVTDKKYHVVFRKQVDGECRASFTSQADLDQDGIGETFSMGFCDYGGNWMLTFKNSRWILWMEEYQPGAC